MRLIDRKLTIKSGENLSVFDMITNHGLSVSLIPIGASIQKIALKDADGEEIQMALGSPSAGFYSECPVYAGATLAPNAGRIQGGLLSMDGRKVALTANDGPNQLHGGPHNLSNRLWETVSISQNYDSASILFKTALPDDVDGYPGNRNFFVRYTLEDSGWLSIRYMAETDAPTYINMSNHTYWNLSGDFSKSGLDQELTVYAANVCFNDASHLPQDLVSVAGTAFDFRSPRILREQIQAFQKKSGKSALSSRLQLDTARGYNHAFLLERDRNYRQLRSVCHPKSVKKACILSDPESGRMLVYHTDAPALVVYSGGFLPSGLPLHSGAVTSPSCAVALEAQDVPNTPFFLPEACRLTYPGTPFLRTIRMRIV